MQLASMGLARVSAALSIKAHLSPKYLRYYVAGAPRRAKLLENFGPQETNHASELLEIDVGGFCSRFDDLGNLMVNADPKADDEIAIRQLVAMWNDGFNRKDAHTCAVLSAEDGDFTSVRGDSDHGRTNVENIIS